MQITSAGRIVGPLLSMMTAGLLVAVPSAAADYPRGETLDPTTAPQGPATPLLRVVGRTIVDGEARIPVTAGAHVSMVGRVAEDYLVLTTDADYRNWSLVRVDAAGSTTTLVGGRSSEPEVMLSDDAAHVALATHRRRGRILRVVDTATGSVVARREFGYVAVLDFAPRRMVLGEWESGRTPSRTVWWNPFANKTARIAPKAGYLADVAADRVGVFTGDPYLGGCQEIWTLSAPRTRVWRSCDEVVLALSPNGRRMVTTHILSDGPGPSVLQVRGARGRVLDTYRARWFGFVKWESDTSLLVQAAGPDSVGVLRCTVERCERASRTYGTGRREPWLVMPPWTFAEESLADR